MKEKKVSFNLNGSEVVLESGWMAKQADGAVVARCGDNVVLVTVVSSHNDYSNNSFFPLTVEYSEKFYSVGKIPGGYFKREGRPTAEAILNCRLIDRHLRPCFAEGYNAETQVVATVLSYDGTYSLTSLAAMGASAALEASDIPFEGPTCALQVAYINDSFVINPSLEQLESSTLTLFVAGTKEGILMVEGESQFAQEKDILEALRFAHDSMKVYFKAQEDLISQLGGPKSKRAVVLPKTDTDFTNKVKKDLEKDVKHAYSLTEKMPRYAKLFEIFEKAKVTLLKDVPELDKGNYEKQLKSAYEDLKYTVAREKICKDKKRIDNREFSQVRPIHCEVGLLPRVHGSALFTRGETQVLGTVTLGSGDDEQFIDSLDGLLKRKFLLHYNFPPFCVGEVGRMGGQSRREIGHGVLAERGLKAILPDYEKFPYTLRIVSEVLESNGSSSMGTVCSGMLALLQAGVPVKDNVAGIAMGLIKEGSDCFILSDILGDEDHLGDMDFKVVGSRKGVTAVQMDIKVKSLDFNILEKALEQAKEGRCHILDEMEKEMKNPNEALSEHAPRVEVIKVKPEKVREVIGSGGKVIKGIIEKTGVKMNIEDDGTINIVSSDKESRNTAVQMVNDICKEVEKGEVYTGKVISIKDFGAFVQILPNTVGLLHISEIDKKRINKVTDVLAEGDELEVQVINVDRQGRVKVSRKALL